MIYEKSAFLLTVHVGEATDPNTGEKFQLSLVNGHIPAVRSETSDRTYVLPWQDILAMALAAGVTKEPT